MNGVTPRAGDERCGVLRNESVAEGFHRACLRAPGIARAATPGQFVQVRVSATVSPLLRLPLSIAGTDPEEGVIELLYERRGPKSGMLSAAQAGAELVCLGPLGKGFAAAPGMRSAVLVGGGIGLPPLLFWGRRLVADGLRTVLLAGARSVSRHLPESLLAGASQTLLRATDDGSLGHPGLVSDLLAEELADRRPDAVYACGPHGMLAAVARLCGVSGVSCQVSLEEYMACGIGICVGCVVEAADASRRTSAYDRYRRVCIDGPVFDARDVRWE